MTRYAFPFMIITLCAALGADIAADWVGGYTTALAERTAQQMMELH